jgi:hypothetical protein
MLLFGKYWIKLNKCIPYKIGIVDGIFFEWIHTLGIFTIGKLNERGIRIIKGR